MGSIRFENKHNVDSNMEKKYFDLKSWTNLAKHWRENKILFRYR